MFTTSLKLGKQYPFQLYFNKNGSLEIVYWLVTDSSRRENDLPFRINYYENGGIQGKTWYDENGDCHRVSGPAYIDHNTNGIISCEEYYLAGVFMSKNDWLKDSRVINHSRKTKNKTKGNLISDVSL